MKLEKNNENIYSLSRKIANNLNKISVEVDVKNSDLFERYYTETELYLNDLWDNLFNMGLNPNNKPHFIKQGFKALNEFNDILDKFREIRGKIHGNENLVDTEEDLNFENVDEDVYEECEALLMKIADTRTMLNDIIPIAIKNQINFQ